MSINLKQILLLVGKLDDSAGEGTARERFRRFLEENVREIGQLRDHIEDCLRVSGDQYNRALQDLVNHVGHFLGFEVGFGRYQGVPGQVGFDGYWKSPTRFHIVIEVKTTETYAIKTATLVGYVDTLISEKKIPDWGNALGLYVIGRPDPEVRQLENAIVAEKRTHQLRVVSIESLLSLAEMMNEYDVSHEDILAVLRPSGPVIDPVIDLMVRLVAQREAEKTAEEKVTRRKPIAEVEAAYWLTPVKSDEEQTAEECIKKLVGQHGIYAFGERTPGRKHLKPRDWICFYATGNGVVAHAKVVSKPEKKPHPKVHHSERYPWVFRLENTKLYFDNPVILDADVRSQLDAFQGRDPDKSWAWFVQAARKVTSRDFKTLTRMQTE